MPLKKLLFLSAALPVIATLLLATRSSSADDAGIADDAGQPVPVTVRARGDSVAGMTIADCQRDLESHDRVKRVRAIRTLGVFDDEASDALLKALGHDDPAVRFLAATHLGRIGGKPLAAALDSLTLLAKSRDEAQADHVTQPLAVRMGAAYALCEAGQTERFLPVLIEAISFPDRGTACYSADLIGRLGPDASAATETLEDAYARNKPGVKGGDYHVGGAAMNALRKIRGQ